MLEYFAADVGPKTAVLREGDSTSHGDYELRYSTIETGAAKPQHIIEAHAPEGHRVGFMSWMGSAPHAIERIEVNPSHQRKGLASAMWNWAQENARPKPKHSRQRTDQGDAWARSVGGPMPRRQAQHEAQEVLFPRKLGSTMEAEGIESYFGGGDERSEAGRRVAGRGKPRRNPGGGQGNGSAPEPGGGGPAQGQPSGEGDSAGGRPEGPRPVEFHPAAHKDLKGLDKPVQKQILGVIDDLANDRPTQTHALTMALKGWHSTKVSRGHRIVHRPTGQDGGIHVGYVGLHEYDRAIRRLTSLEREASTPAGDEYQDPTHGWPKHQRAISLAQEQVRIEHPSLTRTVTEDEGESFLRGVLKEHGHPGHEDAFCHIHPGVKSFSCTGLDKSTGAVGVLLHPSKADYGTIAHEAAHLLHDHQTGRIPGESKDDHEVHGPAFANHYAHILDSQFGKKYNYGGNRRGGPGSHLLNEYYSTLAPIGKTAKQDTMYVGGYLGDVSREQEPGDFRRVLYTSPKSQLTAMTLQPGEDIGKETHTDVDQILVLIEGEGECLLGGNKQPFTGQAVLCVPQGIEHNIINTGKAPMRLATVYAPAHHAAGTVHHTKADAKADKGEEFKPVEAKRRPKLKSRVFGRTHGLDPRLFDGDHLKPSVREAVMADLNAVLQPLLGSAWQGYIKVYLAGSEASEWTSKTLEGNGDFDTLLGVDYEALRGAQGRREDWQSLSGPEIDARLNKALREHYNLSPWHAPFGGVWDRTGYFNGNAYDIKRIKPYAAYSISDDEWAVRPPHLPDWDFTQHPLYKPLLAEMKGYADAIEAIDAMPDPHRSRQGRALWEHLHSDRARAFSDEGTGWDDPGNLVEKALAEWGLWDKLVEIRYGKQKTSAAEVRFSAGRMRLSDITMPGEGKLSPRPYTQRQLAADVRKNGIQEPLALTTEQDPETGEWRHVSINGMHRLDAGRRAGVKDAPVVISHPPHVDPPLIDRRDSTREEHSAVYDTERSGKWAAKVAAKGEYCETCKTEHDYQFDENDHYRSHTDWDQAYPKIRDEIYRGMAVQLSPEAHARVHSDAPVHERAHALLNEVTSRPLGMHWTDNSPEMAGSISEDEARHLTPRQRQQTTHVILHADKPAREHVEDDIQKLVQGSVISRHSGNPEGEVPLKEGAPVKIWGISWKRHGDSGWHGHEFDQTMHKTASGPPVEHVRVDKLWPHREWDHQPGGYSYERDGGGPYGWKHDVESWESNKRSVAEEGIQHPITLEYNPKTHSAYVGEGNHRLHWARELGHETVPVKVWRTSKDMHPRYRLPGANHLPEGEHIPQDLPPHAVLPEDYFPTHKTAGAKGDLPEGLSFEHRSSRDGREHQLIARHPDAPHGAFDNHVGHMTWWDDDGEVAMINVEPDWQRRGVASELHRRAKEITPHLQHAPENARTDQGAAWIKSLSGARGDLPKLTFSHLAPADNHSYGGADQDTHTLHAHLPDGTHVGELSWFGEDGMIRDVDVHRDHRRKGIAGELLRRAREIQPEVHHSDALTPEGKAWAERTAMLEYFTASEEGDTDYRMQHRPPDADFGAPLHDLAKVYPEDIYTHPHYYDGGEPGYQEAHSIAQRVKGQPDAKVTIYRALPAEHAHQGFRPGDWVSTSKEYAVGHGKHNEDPKHDWPVIRTTVPAKHLQTNGDSLLEYGYTGPHKDMPIVSYKGGYHQEIRHGADGMIKPVKRRKPKTASDYKRASLVDYFGEAA